MRPSGKISGILCSTGILAMATMFILSGCATKKYVGEYVGEKVTPVADRVAQTETKVGQTEGQIAKLGDRVTANEGKISKVEGELVKVDAKAEQALANFGKLKFERRLVIEMKEGANFEFNSTTLTDEAKRSIDAFIDNLKGDLAGGQNAVILVAGHADNSGSEDINYELGKRRADAVSRYLLTQKKIEPLRVVTVSYGETSPIAGNDTREGRAKNRRVEIIIYSEGITK
jgi:peptidoglycan-associated lipoprotein